MRTYIAFCDDGHDYIEVEYQSTFRNGSRGNIEAARHTLNRKFGYKRSKQIAIIHTQLVK